MLLGSCDGSVRELLGKHWGTVREASGIAPHLHERLASSGWPARVKIDLIKFDLTDTHDDVIKWKHFPRYWPFVWGIHRSPVNSPHKSQWRGALMFSLICAWINGLSKQSWGWWFETPPHQLWRHCNVSWSARAAGKCGLRATGKLTWRKKAEIWKTTFSKAFQWMEIVEFWLKLSHYLNQPINSLKPVYGFATIYRQTRCIRWGHSSLFWTAASHLS